MTKLSKTTRVLERGYLRSQVGASYRRFGSEDTAVLIDRQSWEDMGSPDVVTITVEPGDQLNND